MSDSSFKTKYRSRTFDEYIGNDMLKTTILNRFATDEPFPTSLMVFGQSGCGKTTIGRLIVKQVLCKNKVSFCTLFFSVVIFVICHTVRFIFIICIPLGISSNLG